MKTQEVVIKPSVKVVMMPDTEILDEVTVVAYGTKRKQDLVGSISSVKNEIISNSQATSVSNALEGAVAGLQVVSSSGQPGQDANIVLRGIGSISASNNALIVFSRLEKDKNKILSMYNDGYNQCYELLDTIKEFYEIK